MEDLGTTIDGESTGNKRRGGDEEEAVVSLSGATMTMEGGERGGDAVKDWI